MNNNKAAKFLITGMIIFIFSLFAYSAENDEIVFKWAFLQKNNNGKITSMDFTKDVVVKKNDMFKIYIQPEKNAYVYLYLYDAQDGLSLLFPENIDDFNKKYSMNKEYLIPSEVDEWFALDENKGTERFLLLVSKSRQKNLEDLTKKYSNLLNSKSQDKMLEAKQNLLDEIKKVNLENSKFVVLAEKPTPMAGVTRSLKEILQYVVEVKSKGFYQRTFRLQHE